MSSDITRIGMATRYSEAAVFHGVVYLAGMVPECEATDIREIGVMNEVWDAWVVPGTAPPRATVQAALADPAWKIEVVVTAAQG